MDSRCPTGLHPGAEAVAQVWAALPGSLQPIRREVTGRLVPLSLTEDARSDLVLATDEAVANSIDHAYAVGGPDDTVELRLWTEPTAVCIEIVDHGRWRPPTTLPTDRGYGLRLMRQLIDTVIIEHGADGTRVLLRHPLDRVPAMTVGHTGSASHNGTATGRVSLA